MNKGTSIIIKSLSEYSEIFKEDAFDNREMSEDCRECVYSSLDDAPIHSASEEPNDSPECNGNSDECLLVASAYEDAENEYYEMISKL